MRSTIVKRIHAMSLALPFFLFIQSSVVSAQHLISGNRGDTRLFSNDVNEQPLSPGPFFLLLTPVTGSLNQSSLDTLSWTLKNLVNYKMITDYRKGVGGDFKKMSELKILSVEYLDDNSQRKLGQQRKLQTSVAKVNMGGPEFFFEDGWGEDVPSVSELQSIIQNTVTSDSFAGTLQLSTNNQLQGLQSVQFGFIITTAPTSMPVKAVTNTPTSIPTKRLTSSPTKDVTAAPTKNPTDKPTRSPTKMPTSDPTPSPSNTFILVNDKQAELITTPNPTSQPVEKPKIKVTQNPTKSPTKSPVKFIPVNRDPTSEPTEEPEIAEPDGVAQTVVFTQTPTKAPVAEETIFTSAPTKAPVAEEIIFTSAPTKAPSVEEIVTTIGPKDDSPQVDNTEVTSFGNDTLVDTTFSSAINETPGNTVNQTPIIAYSSAAVVVLVLFMFLFLVRQKKRRRQSHDEDNFDPANKAIKLNSTDSLSPQNSHGSGQGLPPKNAFKSYKQAQMSSDRIDLYKDSFGGISPITARNHRDADLEGGRTFVLHKDMFTSNDPMDEHASGTMMYGGSLGDPRRREPVKAQVLEPSHFTSHDIYSINSSSNASASSMGDFLEFQPDDAWDPDDNISIGEHSEKFIETPRKSGSMRMVSSSPPSIDDVRNKTSPSYRMDRIDGLKDENLIL